MPVFQDDPESAIRGAERTIRKAGIRYVARETGIPLTCVSRAARNIGTTSFYRVLLMVQAALKKRS
jgi:hypothetical protein